MITHPTRPPAKSLAPPAAMPQALPERSPSFGQEGHPAPAALEKRASEPSPTVSPLPLVPEKSRFGWIWWLIVAGLGTAGWYYRPQWQPVVMPYLARLLPHTNVLTEKPKARVALVTTAKVTRRDMPLYLNALGTVTPFKMVTVRSRVEGQLIRVAFTEGQTVEEGDLLAEIDPRPFEVLRDQAQGQLTRDEATLKTAKRTLNRYESLLPSKATTGQQVEEQAALVQQAQGAIISDQAQLADAQLKLDFCRITAPISGRIGLRQVDEGNIVRMNEASGLAVITQVKPISLVFTIPQDEIARVQRQMNGSQPLTVEAFDRNLKSKLATGRLEATDNQVDPATGTLKMKAVFDNEDGLLFPNQFVNARLLVETRVDSIVVPSAAVQRGPTSMFVYVVKDDETVELRNVIVGPTEAGETLVESGLDASETVVTEGLDKLQPGAKVSVRTPDSEKKEGEKGRKGKGDEKGAAVQADQKEDRPSAGSASTDPALSDNPKQSSPVDKRATP